MRQADFKFRLVAASYCATQFASTMVRDKLPFEFRYYAALNSSCDEHREADEVVFPEDNSVIHHDLTAEQIAELLCRDERVPQWIDISVAYKTKKHTYLLLRCCGRYHSGDERLYYHDQGSQPFGIKSPSLPKHYKDDTPFRLPKEKTFLEYLSKTNKMQNKPQ